jgi:hypothetical protein
MTQVLEKTQTEAYIDFVAKYPDIKFGQRTLDKLNSLFNILVLILFCFPPEIHLAGIPNCLQSCILHLYFSRFSPLTDAVTVFIASS